MVLQPLLDYLSTVTTWLYDESKNIELVSEQRDKFEAARVRESATDLERVQNHINFINAFIGKSFVEKHGYFSQRLTQHLKNFNAGIKLYLKLAKNEKEKKDGARNYYVYGDDLDSNCQLNPFKANTDAQNILPWLEANWIPIIDVTDATYVTCGALTRAQTMVFAQAFLGMLASAGLMSAIFMSVPNIGEGDNSSSSDNDEYEWTDANISLFVLWFISFVFAGTNHMFFHKDINDVFNQIDSYLTNRDVVALYKTGVSSIIFFEIISLLLHSPIAILYLGVTNGSKPHHWLSLFAYYPSAIAAQFVGRGTDAVIRTISHYGSQCATALSAPLFFRQRPNSDIESARLLATNYGTINSDPADQQEKDNKKSCWSRFF